LLLGAQDFAMEHAHTREYAEKSGNGDGAGHGPGRSAVEPGTVQPGFLEGLLSGLKSFVWDSLTRWLGDEWARLYARGVKSLRRLFITALAGAAGLMLLAVGFILLHAALFLWLPWEQETKILLLFICAGVYMLAGAAVVWRLCTTRFWMKFTGANRQARRGE
jgi:hypothetical protein